MFLSSDHQDERPAHDPPGPDEGQAIWNGQALESANDEGPDAPAPAQTPRRLPITRWELAIYAGLIAVALGMRLWDLGDRALSHDEILHAWFSWRLFSGEGYAHSPMMHGPFQFHGTALSLYLFGDNLATTRVLPALFGAALVGLPLLLRSYLGRYGALFAAALLAFSPILLYYSRYARNDIYMVVWAVALAAAMFRFLDTGQRRYLYLTALFLALALATKETSYIVIAMFGVFLGLRALPDLGAWIQNGARNGTLSVPSAALRAVGRALIDLGARWRRVFEAPGRGWSLLKALLIPFRLIWQFLAWLGTVPAPRASRPGALLLLMITLTLPQWAAGTAFLQDILPVTLAIPDGPLDQVGTPDGAGWTVGFAILGVLGAASLIWGLAWNWRVWLPAAVLFYVVWGLLYTTFLTNWLGLGTGVWQSLGYWVAQHDVARGGQPWHYYLVISSLYEALPFLFFFIASGCYVWRSGPWGRRFGGGLLLIAAASLAIGYMIGGSASGYFGHMAVGFILAAVAIPVALERHFDPFALFLVFWAGVTFLAYTLAGEKMPWLLVNITVPMILLSARFLGDLVETVEWRRVVRLGGALLLVGAPLLGVFLIRLLLQSPTADAGAFWTAAAVCAVILGVAALLTARVGVRNGLSIALLGIAAALFLYGARTGVVASFFEEDVGREMLVYAHGTPSVREFSREVDRLAAASGKGPDLALVVDNDDYWTWTWYLRNYNNVSFVCLDAPDCNVPEDRGDVVLVSGNNKSHVDPQLEGFSQPREALRLYWFPETYKGLDLGDLWAGFTDAGQRREVINYILNRKIEVDPLRAENVYLYYRDGLVP